MSLLNKTETKKHILMLAHEHQSPRIQKYERVSQKALQYLERKHLQAIKDLIDSQRRGVTITPE
tara:strand:- start:530 stop:721 length:192 start_codon:yes stop_codon:yes gene_type:complete